VEVGLELKETNHCILQYINEKWQHIGPQVQQGSFTEKSSPSFLEILNIHIKIELRKQQLLDSDLENAP